MTDIPHFAFPFQRGPDGHVEVVEQDTQEHVMACEQVILACPIGFRQEKPEFGWPMPTFRTAPLDLNGLAAALSRWEPRGAVDPHQWRDAADAATQHFRINVTARLSDQQQEGA